MPLGVYPVTQSGWPTVWKTAVSGILFFGFEITAVPAAAIMGKENFERIIALARSWLRRLKPAGEVGEWRHAIGLALFLLPIVPMYIMAYAPAWLPDDSPERLWVNLAADVIPEQPFRAREAISGTSCGRCSCGRPGRVSRSMAVLHL